MKRSDGKLLSSAVLLFSILGTIILLYLSTRASAPEVPLSGIDGREGEQVTVEGTVIGTTPTTLYLYGDGVVAKVYMEQRIRVSILDKVRMRAEVISSTPPTLQMVSKSSFVVLGRIASSHHTFNTTPAEGEIMQVEGVARGVASAGYSVEGRILPFTAGLNEVLTGGLPFTWHHSEELREGSLVKATGVFLSGRLHLYGEDSVEITGVLSPQRMSLGELVRAVEGGEEELLRPIQVTGYVLYEPTSTHFYLTDALPSGLLSVMCVGAAHGLHKGDAVVLKNATVVMDSSTLRVVLEADEVEVVERHGPWEVTVEALAESAGGFLGARVVVEGWAVNEGNWTLLEGEGGGRIAVVGGDLNEGSYYRIEGVVTYIESGARYAVRVG
ncbi:MAG: hypothetical protein DRJ35_08410 [Thermoprotei archaeon]|nr:MAG: hypothetical protein DRJ35_08410 [Thermoprotei archaeon]